MYLKLVGTIKEIEGEQANLKDFEKESANFFEACLPIEEIARRGVDTMRYGPLKSIGLWNPKWGDLFDRENRLNLLVCGIQNGEIYLIGKID